MSTKGSFSQSLGELKKYPWYWGAISPETATRLLRARRAGTFLLRDSRSECSLFTLSYVAGDGVFHSRIYCFNGRFCLGGPNALIQSGSLVDFMDQAVHSSDGNGQIPTTQIFMHPSSSDPSAQPIELKYPLGRNQFLPSLRYICRLVIRDAIRDTSLITTLPVPKRMKKFLAAADYLSIC